MRTLTQIQTAQRQTNTRLCASVGVKCLSFFFKQITRFAVSQCHKLPIMKSARLIELSWVICIMAYIDSHCIEQNGELNGCIYSKTVSFIKSHTQPESANSVICASVLLYSAGYTSRSSHTPSSLLPIAPLVRPDKSMGYPSSTTWRWGWVAAKHILYRFCATLPDVEAHILPARVIMADQACAIFDILKKVLPTGWW